jgi:hypothetical protein
MALRESKKYKEQTHYFASSKSGRDRRATDLRRHCSNRKVQKQTHFEASPRSGPEAAEGPQMATADEKKMPKQTHFLQCLRAIVMSAAAQKH